MIYFPNVWNYFSGEGCGVTNYPAHPETGLVNLTKNKLDLVVKKKKYTFVIKFSFNEKTNQTIITDIL